MNTKIINTALAVPGMKVVQDVHSFSDQLIIPAGTVLTDRIITRLKFYMVPEIRIEEPDAIEESTEPVYMIHPEDYHITKVRESEEFKNFSKTFMSSLVNTRIKINSFIHKKAELNRTELLSDVYNVLGQCKNSLNIMDMLHCMREFDDTTFIHGINVALIATTLGMWLKYPQSMLDDLMLAGLLHDIGKLTIPVEILNKPGKLTEMERTTLRTHAMNGYELLKDLPLSPHVKYAAMMHHERCDGSGYPLGLKRGQIDDFANIIAIADVYDAMTSSRVYRGAICPFEVIRHFESEGLSRFDTHFVMTFLEGIVLVYLNNTVRLTDGRIGEIVMVNRTALSRPVIRVGNEFIDLSQETHLDIEALV